MTTFNRTVEMARVTVSGDLVYIRGTDYPGEYTTARDFQVPAAQNETVKIASTGYYQSIIQSTKF